MFLDIEIAHSVIGSPWKLPNFADIDVKVPKEFWLFGKNICLAG